MKISKRLLKWLNNFLLLTALVFLFFFLKNSIGKIDLGELVFNIWYLFFSFLSIILAQFLQALVWHRLTLANSCNIGMYDAIFYRLKNELLKYIPGKVSQFGSILIDYNLKGASKTNVAISIFLENIFSILGSAVLSVCTLTYFNFAPGYILLIFFLVVFSILFFYKLILPYTLKIYNKVKKENANIISMVDIRPYLFYYTIIWFLFGLGLFFLIKSVNPLPNSHIWLVVGAFCVSSIFGFIMFFVPAGVGFREGGLVFFLRNIIPAQILIIPVILSRVQLVICDLITFGAFFLIKKYKKK